MKKSILMLVLIILWMLGKEKRVQEYFGGYPVDVKSQMGVVQGSQRLDCGCHSSLGEIYIPRGCSLVSILFLIFSLSSAVVVAFMFRFTDSF